MTLGDTRRFYRLSLLALAVSLWAQGAWAATTTGSPVVDVEEGYDPQVIDISDSVSGTSPITYTVLGSAGPDAVATGVTIDSDGVVQFSAMPDANGQEVLEFQAQDMDGPTIVQVTVNVAAVNDAPSFATGTDELVYEDVGAQNIAGWATAIDMGPDDEDAVQSPTFNVTSDNHALFSAQPAIDGTGQLSFTPAANAAGMATVTVSVSDDGGTANGGVDTSASDSFTITIEAINDAPTFVAGADVSVDEDEGSQTFASWATAISAGAPNESGQALAFSVLSNDNTSLFSVQPEVDHLTGDLSFTASDQANGVATLTLALTDNGGTANGGIDTSHVETFTISVGAVNDEPTFAAGGNQLTIEDAGAVNVPGWASGISPGPENESEQALSFEVIGNTAPHLFSSGPSVDADTGDLTFATAADANGVATITLALSDDGGGMNTSEREFVIELTPVNDAPTFTPGSTVSVAEDAGPISASWATDLSAGPADEAAQSLSFTVVSNSNPALFAAAPSIDATTGELNFETVFDANGSATLTVNLSDDGGTANGGENTSADHSFDIVVAGVDDAPEPQDDTITIAEDSGEVLIPVLANDYLAEQPTGILSVTGSLSPVQEYINRTGDTVGGANGTVEIVGDQIQYTPKEHFTGEDWFDYTIQDADGDTATARVVVTVTPVNDLPSGVPVRTFPMFQGQILEVSADDGLLFGAYDLEGATIDPDTGLPVGAELTVQIMGVPGEGETVINNVDGSFSFTPPVNETGVFSIFYHLVDEDGGQSELSEVLIPVNEVPEPPEPPEPGEVALIWNLANVPLEQSTSVSPNVIVMMDDSGSMDWHTSVSGEDEQGGFVINNSGEADRYRVSRSFYYLWDLRDNIFGINETNGRILPTEEALEDDWQTDNNEYGVWRARNAQYNRLYYNPEVHYTPWVGVDVLNQPFGNANPSAVRLDPTDPTLTINILDEHEYEADDVPMWRSDGGHKEIFMDDGLSLYIPMYYATTATPPLQWNDDHDLVEIRPGFGYTGGAERDDCAADDGNPLTCTYAQEIQNFANYFQYYRKREYAAKNGLGKVVAQVQDIRIGYETINNNNSEPVRDMNDLHTAGNKRLLMDEIYGTDSNGGTPLRRALRRAGRMFADDDGPILPDPQGLCQQNFTLLFSDGYWNGGDPDYTDNEDGDGDTAFDGGIYADEEDETLADVAMYFYENDLRGGMEDLVPVSQRDRLGAPEDTFESGGAARMHQHMKTYTVAFGVVGEVDPDDIPDDPTSTFDWPDPEDSAQGKIDDMLHAAVNGRGQFLSAVNPQELQTALEAAFLEFTQAASSTSAAAFNSTSLQSGTLLYRGFYDLRDFSGELSATAVDDDGNLASAPVWRASQQVDAKAPNDRVLVTFDNDDREGAPFRFDDLTVDQQLLMSEDEVNYIRGNRGQEQPSGSMRRRAAAGGLLGDIVNSSPVFVGRPRGLDRDQEPYPESSLYSDFAENNASRRNMVYVGANDGILHGFDAESGEELFGYVPNKIIDGSQTFHSNLDEFTSPFYQHKYYVDLSPRISDAYVRSGPGAVGRSWNSVLLGGLGAGGKGFFALNVTDPGDFSSESSAASTVMWEFTDEDDTSPNAALDPSGAPVKDLGYALSLPTLAMSNVTSGGEQEWVAIFGNGTNSTAGIAKLFVLFMDRGVDGWGPSDFVKLDTGRGVPVAPAQLAGYPNGLGTPALVDEDLNGTVDLAYAGDRMGNLYRFDLCNRDEDTGECDTSSGSWSVTHLFTATYDDGGTEELQPILSQPLVMKHPHEEGFLVVFGTGSYQTREDADSQDIQSIYAIWDRGADNPVTAQSDAKATRLVEQTITNVVDDSVSPPQTRRIVSRNPVDYRPDGGGTPGVFGWYVDLDMQRAAHTASGGSNPDTSGKAPPQAQFPGEKAIRRFSLRNGVIATTTVLPSLDEFSCYGTRPGALLLFDLLSGGDASGGEEDRAILDFNNDGEINEEDMVEQDGESYAGGLLFNQSELDGALVDLSELGGGDGDDHDFFFICGGNDCERMRREPPDSQNQGRLSWRELHIDN